MNEFNEFLDYCYTALLYKESKCNNCNNNKYCHNNNCNEGDCSKCLEHILRAVNPQFHYSCKRITYFYALRFFNRFASEIKEFFKVKFKVDKLTIASLGCGPASELFGLVDGVRSFNPHIRKVSYLGYDTNNVWKELNDQATTIFSYDKSLDIRFHRNDMFNDWQDHDIEKVNILILNYLLSDCIKYQNNKSQLESFLDKIVHFIIAYKVNIIVCNDINLYGYPNCPLDSSVKCMEYLKTKLSDSCNLNGVKYYGLYYPSDKYKPDGWHQLLDESLLFPQNPLYSQFSVNINRRASKYMILLTDFK